MVRSTHDLRIGESEVVKRYRCWERGEPDREWDGLSLLHGFAPGLAPQPLRRRDEGGVPVIVMSRVPGESLGSSPLTPAQVAAVGQAMRRMYAAVPAQHLTGLPERRSGPAELGGELRSWIRRPHEPTSPLVESALTTAGTWVAGSEVTALVGQLAERVFTQADGNIGNLIWDGSRCYVVDFEDCGVSDPAYEVADLVEHVSVWLPGLLQVEALVRSLGFTAPQEARLSGFRRLMAIFWLFMLLPGNPASSRNPEGTVERQAQRVLDLLH